MIKLEIVDESLQISKNGTIILVAPKNSCAIDVLALYDSVPRVYIYNKFLGTSTSVFNNPLSNCEDSGGVPFTIGTFITFAENNLGFSSSGSQPIGGSLGEVIVSDGNGWAIPMPNCVYNPDTNTFTAGGSTSIIAGTIIESGVTSMLPSLQSWGVEGESKVATGEILYGEISAEEILRGNIVFRAEDGRWGLAIADHASEKSTGMLGVALNTTRNAGASLQVLIRGFVSEVTSDYADPTTGSLLYLSAINYGAIYVFPPSSVGQVSRILGYSFWSGIDQENGVFITRFDPDNTWVEL